MISVPTLEKKGRVGTGIGHIRISNAIFYAGKVFLLLLYEGRIRKNDIPLVKQKVMREWTPMTFS